MMPTALQDVEKTEHIAFNVGIGILNGIAHTGLTGKIDDEVKMVVLKKAFHGFAMGEVEFQETIGFALHGGSLPLLLQSVSVNAAFGKTGKFESRRIVGVEIVNAHHGIACTKEGTNQVESNETGGSGHKCLFHFTKGCWERFSRVPIQRLRE